MADAKTNLGMKIGAILIAALMPLGQSLVGQLVMAVSYWVQLLRVKRMPPEANQSAIAQDAKHNHSLQQRLTFSRCMVLLMNTLAIWMLFTSFFAFNITKAVAGSLLVIINALISFKVIVPWVLDNPGMRRILATIVISSATLGAIFSLWVWPQAADARAYLPLIGSNGAGQIFVITLVVTFLVVLKASWRLQILLLCSGSLQIAALLATKSRGSWVAFIATVLVMLLCLHSKKLVLIISAAALIFTVIVSSTPELQTRLLSIVDMQHNSDRLMLWQAGTNMIKTHPLVGIGVDNFSQVYSQYAVLEETRLSVSHSHNIILDFGLSTGIPGLIMSFSLLFGVAIAGIRLTISNRASTLVTAAYAIYIGILTHLQFDIITYSADTSIMLLIPLGILLRAL